MLGFMSVFGGVQCFMPFATLYLDCHLFDRIDRIDYIGVALILIVIY